MLENDPISIAFSSKAKVVQTISSVGLESEFENDSNFVYSF